VDKKNSNGAIGELQEFTLLKEHTGLIIRLLSRKSLIISGYSLCSALDGTVRLWRLSQQNYAIRQVSILPHIQSDQRPIQVTGVEVSLIGLIASLAADGVVRLWTSEAVLFNTIQQSTPILSIDWDISGSFLLVSSKTSLTVWDSQGIFIKEHKDINISDIKTAIWRSPNEFTVQTSPGIWMWRHNENPVKIFEETVTDLKWSPSKTYLAIIQESLIGIYQDEYDIWWLSREFCTAQFCSRDYLLVTASCSGEIYFWDLNRRSVINRLVASVGKVFKVVFRKDDEFMAACGDEEVQIWNMDNQNVMRKIKIQNKISEM
jgi:WD40 repeat protein